MDIRCGSSESGLNGPPPAVEDEGGTNEQREDLPRGDAPPTILLLASDSEILDQAAQGFASAIFSGTNGGLGLVPTCPTAMARVEAATNVTATVSFALLKVGAGR
jgi:hypothetical protein